MKTDGQILYESGNDIASQSVTLDMPPWREISVVNQMEYEKIAAEFLRRRDSEGVEDARGVRDVPH